MDNIIQFPSEEEELGIIFDDGIMVYVSGFGEMVEVLDGLRVNSNQP